MPAIAGLRGSGDFATDERPKDFREMILWRRPNGTAPITALLAKAQKSQVADPEFSWWDEPNDIVRLQINNALGYGTTDTTLAVDSADPSAANPENVWGSALNLVPGDLLLVEKTESAAYDNEIMRVESVTNATTFTVTRGVAGTTAASIPDNTFLTKLGSSYAEGTRSPNAASRNPVKYTNYCEIFKTAYELTGTTAAITNLRTGDPLQNDKKRKAFDHSRDIELQILFGTPAEETGSNGKPQRYMGGLRHFISAQTTTIFSAAVTANAFLDAVYRVFDYDTDAGDERIVFCGNAALNELNKIVKADGQIQFGPVITQYGMNLRQYILPQGTLFLRTHPLMNRHDFYSKSMFIVDFSALRWRHTKGRDTHFQDNIQENDADTRKGQWFTEGGLEVAYGGLTCGYIGNISAT